MSTPTGFKLSWRNHVAQQNDWELALLGGEVQAGQSLATLKDPRLSTRVTISETRPDAGEASVILQFKKTTPPDEVPDLQVGLLGLLNYGVSAPGATSVTMTAVVYHAEGATTIEGIDAWERPSEDFPQHLWALLAADRDDVYEVRIQVEAVFGSGGGTVSITAGAFWVGPTWAPPDGIEYSWRTSVVDPGTMGRSVGGQGYARRRQRYRSLEGRAIHVPFAWAFGDPDDATVLDIQQLMYRVGTTDPIVVFARTKDATGALSSDVQHRLGIYGHLSDVGGIEHLGGDLYQWGTFRVDELM